jgi:hypothetical protein
MRSMMIGLLFRMGDGCCVMCDGAEARRPVGFFSY